MKSNELELEMAVLGTILLDSDAVIQVLDLKPEHFASKEHAKVFAQVLDHHEQGLPIDGITIDNIAQYKDYYTSDLPSYASMIKENAKVRKITATCAQVMSSAKDSPSEALLNRLNNLLKEGDESKTTQSVSDTLMGVVERIDRIRLGEETLGISTGLDFERPLGGFEDGALYIVAARPAMGKSAFALEVAMRTAHQGIPVGFMSLEMSADSLTMRMLSNKSGYDSETLRKGKLTDDHMGDIVKHAEELSNLPIHFDDNSFMTAQSLRAKAYAMHRKHGIGMLIIDYLQLLTGDNDSRQQDVADVSRMCKVIAKELSIPVIALSQLNRGVESRPDKRPMLSDLRESGAIEQDADVVMMLYRPEYYGKDRYDESDPQSFIGDSTTNICEVIVTKNRNGATGAVRQVFVKELMQFKNRSHYRE